jgi:hypothetical protein
MTSKILFLSLLALLILVGQHNASAQDQASLSDPKTIPPHEMETSVSTEQWNDLTLTSSDLKAQAPVFGEKDSFPEFTRELVRVQWRKNDPIDLYLLRPAGIAKPPVVLVLYSYPSDTDRFLDNGLCQKLVSKGFAVVGFVSALTGQRYHDRPMKEWFISELQESLSASVHDVQMILNYLSDRTDLDLSEVGIFGQGSGGTIALLAATADKRIKAVDVLDAWGDWPRWLATSPVVPEQERADYLKPEFLSKVKIVDPMQSMAKLADRPIRWQITDFDIATPAPIKQEFRSALPKTAESVEYHSIEEYKERAVSNAQILQWIKDEVTKSETPR